MLPVLSTEDYLKRLMDAPRKVAPEVFAFYEHRLGAICKDPRLMLVPLDDHIVHRGDGVFETLKFVDRKIYQLDAHLERMKRSSGAVFIRPPVPWEEIRAILIELCAASGVDTAILTFFLGRGPGGFTTDPRECPVSSFYAVVRAYHIKPEEFFDKGVTGFRTSVPAKQADIARIKTVNYMPNVLMKRDAVVNGYDFPLCFNDKGFLAEGSTENILLVDDQSRIIAPESENSLSGTTMMRGLELIGKEHPVIFRPVEEHEIYEAHEVIVMGTTLDAVGVVRYNGKPIRDVRPGPVTRRLRELIKQDIVANGVPF